MNLRLHPLLLATAAVITAMIGCSAAIIHAMGEVPSGSEVTRFDIDQVRGRLDRIEEHTCAMDKHLTPVAEQLNGLGPDCR